MVTIVADASKNLSDIKEMRSQHATYPTLIFLNFLTDLTDFKRIFWATFKCDKSIIFS